MALIIVTVGCAEAPEASDQETAPPAAVVPPTPAIPDYRVLDVVDQLNGTRYADVLVPTMTRDTPIHHLQDVAMAIAQKEKFGELSLYCSEEAMKANFSLAYAEANPDALKCYLGRLKGQQYTQ